MRTIHECVMAAAEEAEIAPDLILSYDRRKVVHEARVKAWRMAAGEGHPVTEIARQTNRDHATVVHALGGDSERKALAGAQVLRDRGYPQRAIDRLSNMSGPGLERAEELVSQVMDDSMLLLMGNRGPGKTTMATFWAARRRQRRKDPGLYVKALDLFDSLRATWDTRQSEESVMMQYRRAKFLVIDEIHERAENEWEQRKLTNLLDHRYDDRLVTVLAGNLTMETAPGHLGPSVWSRLNEIGGVVNCDWPSYR